MSGISMTDTLFYALHFKVYEEDCIIEPLIVNIFEYELEKYFNQIKETEFIIEKIIDNYDNMLIINSFDNNKNKCQYSNKYIKRKFRQ